MTTTAIAIAVPLRGGREVLLRRRSERGSLAGTFEFPGGKIEAGEAPLEGAVRELEEETGLRGGAWEPLLVHAHAYLDRSVRLHAFLVRDPEGGSVDGMGWTWVPLERLRVLPLPAANAPIVHELFLRTRSCMLTPTFADALAYAANLHARQFRKGTKVPYVSHLLAVASIVLENGGDEEQAVAALLHDAAEDQGGKATLEDIRRRFGSRVADIVHACTDTFEDPKPPWPERKRAYIDGIPAKSEDAALVALADKLHNAAAILRDHRAVGEAVWARFNATPGEILWYYGEMVRAFDRPGLERMIGELRKTVAELHDARVSATTEAI